MSFDVLKFFFIRGAIIRGEALDYQRFWGCIHNTWSANVLLGKQLRLFCINALVLNVLVTLSNIFVSNKRKDNKGKKLRCIRLTDFLSANSQSTANGPNRPMGLF